MLQRYGNWIKDKNILGHQNAYTTFIGAQSKDGFLIVSSKYFLTLSSP